MHEMHLDDCVIQNSEGGKGKSRTYTVYFIVTGEFQIYCCITYSLEFTVNPFP